MVSSCSPDIHVVSSNSPDHSHQHCFWGSRTSTWFLGIMNISMVSDIASRDHGCLLRILNPENKPYFNLDILLLLRVREILKLRVSVNAPGCCATPWPQYQLPSHYHRHQPCVCSLWAVLFPAASTYLASGTSSTQQWYDLSMLPSLSPLLFP